MTDVVVPALPARVVFSGPRQVAVQTGTIEPLDVGEIRISPDVVGICGTDIELFQGSMAYLTSGFSHYPIVPGHEWTGLVTEVGADVSGFNVGDRVVGECSVGCGRCSDCWNSRYHLCAYRTETGIAGRSGALATSMVFPARAAHVVPDGISPDDAALVEPLAVAYRSLQRTETPNTERLTVIGAGTIGLLTAIVARALDASEITLVEPNADRRRFATELGFVVDDEPPKAPRVVEASGSPTGLGSALDLCQPGGSVVVLGLTGSLAVSVDLDDIVVRDVTVRGSLGSPNVWPQVLALLQSGLRPSLVVSHRFSFGRANEAFALALERPPGVRKILILPNGSEQAAPP